MIYVTVREPDGNSRQIEADQFPCRIGRHREAGVMLSSWRVARHHAQIRRDGRFFTLVDQGSLAGTWVNGTRIVEYSPLTDDDEILIAGYRLQLSGVSETEFTSSDTPVAANVATNMAANSSQVESGKSGESGKLSHFAAPAAPAAHAVPSLSSEASLRIATRHLVELRRHLHSRLLESMDLRRQEIRHLNPEHLRATARTHLERIVADNSEMWPDSLIDTVDIADNEVLIELVLDEAIGLGVLEQLLGGEDITEIMVNGCQPVYVEKQGRLQDTGLRFSSDDAILSVIERIVSPIGRRIDESSPMVDARLPDGSRVNAVIPPLAIEGPCITIRRFNTRRFDSSELVRLGSLSDDMLNFLAWCVERRLNVVVSGGTGSGKTTLLNLLSNHIRRDQRIITIEDAAELQLSHPNKVSLEARPANNEGNGQVSIRDLVRNALRMRPDRIVVGECRGGEALDMLQAMNTGHDGSLTTVHANSARDALSRLEVMVLMSGVEIPVQAIREQIASAVDIVIQQQREQDGHRRIIDIAEVTGMEGTQIQMQSLFSYRRAQKIFLASGNVPSVFDRLEIDSADPIRSLFGQNNSETGYALA